MKRFKSKGEIAVFTVGVIIMIGIFAVGLYFVRIMVTEAQCQNLNTYLKRLYTTEQCDNGPDAVQTFIEQKIKEEGLEYRLFSFEGETDLRFMTVSDVNATSDGKVEVKIFLYQENDSLQKLTICEWRELRSQWKAEMSVDVSYSFDVILRVNMLYQNGVESYYTISDNSTRTSTEQTDVVCE